ncbi:hypothetical protein VNO80_07278 [Phaseolus coccineus]|uniref:Uncharacterized protein n=1 Tax=Phaseolus coccineus TaxID=3886 RepID=A0AAN9NNC6_PHACN
MESVSTWGGVCLVLCLMAFTWLNMYKDLSLPSVASSMCAWICLAMDLVRGPRRSISMDSLPPSRPRRSLLGARRSPWSRRSSWFGPWLPWLDVLGPPPSLSDLAPASL